MERLRRMARELGVGRAMLALRHVHHLGVRHSYELRRARAAVHGTLAALEPLPADRGHPVHMLLHHDRVVEGIWAFQTFAWHAGIACRFIVHDDGSLDEGDAALIDAFLPGARVVRRAEADRMVEARLADEGAWNCLRLRRGLPFAVKLFDPGMLAEGPSFTVLDSDVLFFRAPREVVASGIGGGAAGLYSVDVADNYCLPDEVMRGLLGGPCIASFNPGVMHAPRDAVNVRRVNEYLEHPAFWNADGTPGYYTELTLWAMELTRAGAQPLPPGYAIAPRAPLDGEVVSGHYCGGVRSAHLYYTQALPAAAARRREVQG